MQRTGLDTESLDIFSDYTKMLGVDDNTRIQALTVMETHPPVLLGLSGWPTAGKDVLGVAAMDALGLTAKHLYFAVPMKDEVDTIINACRNTSVEQAVATVIDEQGVTEADALTAVQIIHDSAQNPTVNARTRTPVVRTLLQKWGTHVRRSQNEDYWVQKALVPAVHAIANGQHAYISDVRFVNEVVAAKKLGFFTVRLNISVATVKHRLAERDDLHPSDEELATMLAFPSESSLNDYTGFDLMFDNERDVAFGVKTIIQNLH